MSHKTLLIAAFLSSSIGASTLEAGISFVSSSGALGANDSVDWGQLGPAFTTVPSPSTVTSAGGLIMTVTSSSGNNMVRVDQGNGWAGNFSPGDKLLWNQYNGGDISISFAQGIYGLGGGAQVQSDFFGSFTGTISAYDGANNLLASQSFLGFSSSAGDGSAVFAGLLSDTPDIHRITFVAIGSGYEDFAIGQLQLVTTPVPEPSTIIAGALLLLPFATSTLRILRKRA